MLLTPEPPSDVRVILEPFAKDEVFELDTVNVACEALVILIDLETGFAAL